MTDDAPKSEVIAPPIAPPIAAPIAPAAVPVILPEGWELTTQTMRPIGTGGAGAAGIKPAAPVVSATVATMFAPIVNSALTSMGHPLPVEILVALPTLFAFIGGWFHPRGRT